MQTTLKGYFPFHIPRVYREVLGDAMIATIDSLGEELSIHLETVEGFAIREKLWEAILVAADRLAENGLTIRSLGISLRRVPTIC